jgi:hypothetical protein
MVDDTSRTVFRGLSLLVALIFVVSAQGCVGGAVTSSVYAVSGATAAALHKQRQQFRKNLRKNYTNYQKLFSASECEPKEYRISPEIINYLEKSAPTEDGYAEAQDILLEIYNDTTLSRDVRAHALYLTALTEAKKEKGGSEKAREYLKRVKREFPGTHDCAVETLLEKGSSI